MKTPMRGHIRRNMDRTLCGRDLTRGRFTFDLYGQSCWPHPCRTCRKIARALGQKPRPRAWKWGRR